MPRCCMPKHQDWHQDDACSATESAMRTASGGVALSRVSHRQVLHGPAPWSHGRRACAPYESRMSARVAIWWMSMSRPSANEQAGHAAAASWNHELEEDWGHARGKSPAVLGGTSVGQTPQPPPFPPPLPVQQVAGTPPCPPFSPYRSTGFSSMWQYQASCATWGREGELRPTHCEAA